MNRKKKEEERSLNRSLLAVYVARGSLPRDSMMELECACEKFGLMTLDSKSITKSRRGFSFNFVCSQCETKIPYFLHLPLTTKIRRLRFAINTAAWSFLSRYRRPLFAMGLVAALIGVANTRAASYGFQVLLNEGPRQALSWITDPRTTREKFVRAWTFYSSGELENAREALKPLLGLKMNNDLKTRADVFYLAGLLAGKEDRAQAMEYFHRAAGLYSSLGTHKSLMHAYLSATQLLMDHGDLPEAETYFEMASASMVDGANLGFFHEVQARLFFERGNYPGALSAGLKSYEYYEEHGDVNGSARGMSEIGFYRILLGQMEDGLRDTLAAEAMVLKTGDYSLYFYNLINLYLYNRCMGLAYKPYGEIISERAAKTNDPVLGRFLRFVGEYPCPPKIASGRITPIKGP